MTQREVELTDGTRIESFTLVWTAGTSSHPLLNQLDLPKDRNRLKVSAAMEVEGHSGVWALGHERSPVFTGAPADRFSDQLVVMKPRQLAAVRFSRYFCCALVDPVLFRIKADEQFGQHRYDANQPFFAGLNSIQRGQSELVNIEFFVIEVSRRNHS